MSKIIGISSSATETTQGRDGILPGKTSVNTAYVKALTRQGVTPVILPSYSMPYREGLDAARFKTEYLEHVTRLALGLDGLVLSGGADINPMNFGQELWGATGVDSMRDFMDIALIEAFHAVRKPVLGICRGHQILGLHLGLGNFSQDLSVKDILEYHSGGNFDLKDRQEVVHKVNLFNGLKEYFKDKAGSDIPISVNSWHHQGFTVAPSRPDHKDLGKWKVSYGDWLARAVAHYQEKNRVDILATSEFVIEGFESKATKSVGIQWHPEEFGPEGLTIGYWIDVYLCN